MSIKNDPLALRRPGPGLRRSLLEAFAGKKRLLDVAQVEISSFCPGKCLYCPHTTMRGQWKARNMEDATFAALWPLFLETGRVHLQGWGEPFMHPRFLDFAVFARRAGCLVSTTSCGLSLDEGLARALVDSGIDVIAFSLAGTRPETNNAERPGADFDRVAASIRLLDKVRRERRGVHLELHLAYLLLADHMEEAREIPVLMQELGLHTAVVSTLDYLPDKSFAARAFAPGETAKIAAARKILEETAHEAARRDLDFYYALPQPAPGKDCLEHPGRSVYIDAEGLMSPCIYLNPPTRAADPLRRVFGSCLEQNPLQTWAGPDFAAFRASLANPGQDSLCFNCPKRFAVGNRA